jgi:hypothetical protein
VREPETYPENGLAAAPVRLERIDTGPRLLVVGHAPVSQQFLLVKVRLFNDEIRTS